MGGSYATVGHKGSPRCALTDCAKETSGQRTLISQFGNVWVRKSETVWLRDIFSAVD